PYLSSSVCVILPLSILFRALPPPSSTLFPYTTLFRSLRVLSLARRGRVVRDRASARTHQASQCRIGPQIQTLLFHLQFSVFVESLKQVFDRRAFLDYGFQLRDRRVQFIFFNNPVR